MTVDLDNQACIECGACADVCPEVFEMDERSGKARVIAFEITDRGCVEEAISTCPVECIFWRD
jgi:ferredoxin